MQVACPHCQTKLQLSAAKLPDTPFAIKCPKCENTFQVTPPAPEPVEPVAAPVASLQEQIAPPPQAAMPPQESVAAPEENKVMPPAPPPETVPPVSHPVPPVAQTAAANTFAPVPPVQATPPAITPPVESLPAPVASAPPTPPVSVIPPAPPAPSAPVRQMPPPAPPPVQAMSPPAPPSKRSAHEDELLAGKGTIPNMSVGWTHSMPSPTVADDTSSLVAAGQGDLLQTLAALLTGGAKQNSHHHDQVRKRNIVACLSSQEDLILLHNIFNGLAYELMVAGSVEEVTGMLQSGNQLDILLIDPNYLPEQQGCPSIMRYVNMLNPARRRRLYVAIISQSYRTLDTQTAFANGVNLIVNSADLEQLPVILTKSILDFNNLYRAYNIASGTSPF